MKKKTFMVIALLLAVFTVFTACSDKKTATPVPSSSVQSNSTSTSGTSQSRGNSNSLFDISTNQISGYGNSTTADRLAMLTEVPKEFLKGVGELNSFNIQLDKYGNFKYIVVLEYYVTSGEEAIKILLDYYRSIGGTVEETGNQYNPYSVKFDWGEATEIKVGSDYLNTQFSVVKERER